MVCLERGTFYDVSPLVPHKQFWATKYKVIVAIFYHLDVMFFSLDLYGFVPKSIHAVNLLYPP